MSEPGEIDSKSEGEGKLNIPEILKDFFLKKIEKTSSEEDHKYRKKSKYRRERHRKKSRHRRHSRSSSSSMEQDQKKKKTHLSDSEDIGMERLQKIKKVKQELKNSTITKLPSEAEGKEIENNNESQNLEFYGPSLELLLSGVDASSIKPDPFGAESTPADSSKTSVSAVQSQADRSVCDENPKELSRKSFSVAALDVPSEKLPLAEVVRAEGAFLSQGNSTSSTEPSSTKIKCSQETLHSVPASFTQKSNVWITVQPATVVSSTTDKTTPDFEMQNSGKEVPSKTQNCKMPIQIKISTRLEEFTNTVAKVYELNDGADVICNSNSGIQNNSADVEPKISSTSDSETVFQNGVKVETVPVVSEVIESLNSESDKLNETPGILSEQQVSTSSAIQPEKSADKNTSEKKNRSRSRSKSKPKSFRKSSSKAKYRKRSSRSRSSSRDSKSKKKRRRSRSTSRGKKKSVRHKSRSRSRSRAKRLMRRRRSRSKSPVRKRSKSRSQSRRKKHSRSRSRKRSASPRKDRSRSHAKKISSSPRKDRSRSHSKKISSSSRKDRSRSHSKKRSNSHKDRSRSHSKKRCISPRKDRSRSHSKKRSNSHKDRSRSRSKKRSISPGKERSRSNSKKQTVSLHKERSRSVSKKRTISPRKERSRSGSKKRTVSPRKERSRSGSKKRTVSPRKERSRSGSKKRTVSPCKDRSRSGSKNRTVSPHKERSRSGSKKRTLSPHKRRSRSKSNKKRSRSRSRKRSRRSRSRNRDRSRSRSRRRSRNRKRSKSKSRSRSRERKSSRDSKRSSRSKKSSKIDQAKILETARKNVLKMIQEGTLPEGLSVENLKKETLVSIQAGGKSVQELTDFCIKLSQKENDPEEPDANGKDDGSGDDNGFIHHPFKLKEPGTIKLNIRNAVQLPIKTHSQKIAELSSQFPVSSGNQHKQKELEWIPVVPETSKSEKKTPSTSTALVPLNAPDKPAPPPPPPPPPEPEPVSYPTKSQPAATTTIPALMPPPPPPPIFVTSGKAQEHKSPHPPLALPPPPPPPPEYMAVSYQQMMPMMSQPVMAQQPTQSVFKPKRNIDISAIVAKRFQAVTKLSQNQNDYQALKTLHDAQQEIQDWVESQQVPGMFTGSTDAKVLSVAELCGPRQGAWKFKKDYFSQAPPVSGGKGMSLLKKMGWNPGEGLGKNKEGSLVPLLLDIKTDKKGLVGEGENSKKNIINSFTTQLQGKHPVSALMELCSKRKWKPPFYTCVMDTGPPHKKQFCFKVEINGVEYQPLNPCNNKKTAKAEAAIVCLQALNILPKHVKASSTL